MKILVLLRVKENHKRILSSAAKGAELIYDSKSTVTEETAKSADIIIGNISPKLIKDSTKLRLLQLNTAGTDGYTEPGVLPPQTILTNASGAYGLAISEHMIGMLLCLMKKLDIYRENMNTGSWIDEGNVNSIYGSKTLVVGLGDIGSEFAKRMYALGSEISAIKRHPSAKPDYINKMYDMSELSKALKEADIVATCLPSTKETYKIFNEETFSHMKRGAYFINVGRGSAVDLEALYRTLNEGRLGGACLDVTDPEPLPKDHTIWHAPNTLITPHVSGDTHLEETLNRIIGIAARNIGHVLNNEEPENIVDMETGYRKFV